MIILRGDRNAFLLTFSKFEFRLDFYLFIVHLAVHTFLPSMLQCLVFISKKKEKKRNHQHKPINFSAHPSIYLSQDHWCKGNSKSLGRNQLDSLLLFSASITTMHRLRVISVMSGLRMISVHYFLLIRKYFCSISSLLKLIGRIPLNITLLSSYI